MNHPTQYRPIHPSGRFGPASPYTSVCLLWIQAQLDWREWATELFTS